MEAFLTHLKHDVQCSLCRDTLVQPRVLQCFHIFCKPCIKRNAELIGQVNIFKCPKCSSQTLFREQSDVEDLKPSPLHSRILQVLDFVESEKSCSVSASHSQALWHCLDCNRSLCNECLNSHSVFIKDHKVASLSNMQREDLEAILKRERSCTTHCHQSIELLCQECDVFMCLLCSKDDHKNHTTMSLQEFTAFQKHCLSKNLEEIEKIRCDEKKQQEEIALKIKADGEKAKEQVKKITQKLMKTLRDHEQQLLNQIQSSITKADSNVRILRHTPAAKEYIQNIIDNGIASDMIDMQDCSKQFTYNPFKRHISGIVFDHNEDLSQQVNIGPGEVRFCRWSPDPMMSTVQVDSHLEATKKAKLTVMMKTSTGEVIDELTDDNVDIQISPEDDVQVKDKQMRSGGTGKIEVEFIPRVAGQLTAQVQVNGNAVSNSPLVMDVKPQHMDEIAGDSKLKSALNTGSRYFNGIAVNKTNSRIAVADDRSHCVRVFNMDGDLLLTYGSQGSGQGQLSGPEGLAFLNETDLVIVDYGNNRICIVNTITGTLVKTFGHGGSDNGQFSDQCGVHVDDDCNIVVTDRGNHRVQVFTKNGEYQYQFSLSNQGGFSPYCTVTHNGLFYVSDDSNKVIDVIEMKDNSPTRISTIGGNCHAAGQLQHPWGLAIDNNHNLLVCDYGSYSVHKFTLDGRFIGKTRKLSSNPTFIAVLNDGQFICTTYGGGVFCF